MVSPSSPINSPRLRKEDKRPPILSSKSFIAENQGVTGRLVFEHADDLQVGLLRIGSYHFYRDFHLVRGASKLFSAGAPVSAGVEMPIRGSAMKKVAINFRDVFMRLEFHGLALNPDPVRIRSTGLIFKEVANYEMIVGNRKFELFTNLIIGLEEKLGSDIPTAALRTAGQGITGKVIDTVLHALPPVEDRGKRQPQLGGRIPVDLRVQRDEILLSAPSENVC